MEQPQGEKRPRNTWKQKTRRYLLKLFREGPDRHIELLLAFVIASFAYMQWHTARSSNESTTQQTEQLITAAKINSTAAQQNALAASNFAATEEKINHDLQNAVDRLNAQAQATSDVANGENTANKLAQQALEAQTRPWVGVSEPIIVGDNTLQTLPVLPSGIQNTILFDFSVAMQNYGSSPAIKAMSVFQIIPALSDPNIPENWAGNEFCKMADSIVEKPQESYVIFPHQPPTAPRKFSGRYQANRSDQIVWLAGCIRYQFQISGTTHYSKYLYIARTKRVISPIRTTPYWYDKIESFDLVDAAAE